MNQAERVHGGSEFDLTALDPPVRFERKLRADVTLGELWDEMVAADHALNDPSADHYGSLLNLRDMLSEWFERVLPINDEGGGQ